MPSAALLSSRMITTFGLGRLRPASGTWGSLPPVIIAGLLLLVGLLTSAWSIVWWIYQPLMWVMLLAFAWSVIAGGDRAEAVFGQDPSEVVADETAGQCIPLILMPPALMAGVWWHGATALACAFVLFRLFDVVKVWPCNALQRVPGGWGILLDDLVAGLYAAGGLWLLTLVV